MAGMLVLEGRGEPSKTGNCLPHYLLSSYWLLFWYVQELVTGVMSGYWKVNWLLLSICCLSLVLHWQSALLSWC